MCAGLLPTQQLVDPSLCNCRGSCACIMHPCVSPLPWQQPIPILCHQPCWRHLAQHAPGMRWWNSDQLQHDHILLHRNRQRLHSGNLHWCSFDRLCGNQGTVPCRGALPILQRDRCFTDVRKQLDQLPNKCCNCAVSLCRRLQNLQCTRHKRWQCAGGMS